MITWTIATACVLVYFVAGHTDALRYGFVPEHPSIAHAIASLFVHADLLHLAGNMVFLVIAGSVVEPSMRPLPFLSVYLSSGLVAALAHALLTSRMNVPLVGASGAIAALMGIVAVDHARTRIRVMLTFLPYLFLPFVFLLAFVDPVVVGTLFTLTTAATLRIAASGRWLTWFFSVPAWIAMPLFIAVGSMGALEHDGVAIAAHLVGFAFGALVGIAHSHVTRRARSARLTDVVSTLRGFAITTYTVPLDVLASHLPPGLEPEAITLDDGETCGMVSAVTFLNTDFYVGFAPFVRLVASQTNFRAYVRRGDTRAVYFFGTTLGSRFVFMPWFFWRLPWAYGRNETTFDFDADDHCEAYRFVTESVHGREHLEASGTGEEMGRLDGFPDVATTASVLTHPLVGFVRRRDGRYATYGVDHAPLVLERAVARTARFVLFERLGLVREGQAPHSVLVMQKTEFIVRLPPRTVDLATRISP